MIVGDQSLISINTDLKKFVRGSRTLFVSPETASWMVLEGDELAAFRRLQKPTPVGNFLQAHYSSDPRAGHDFVKRLYLDDLIRINGRSRYDLSTLWKLPQRYPTFLCCCGSDYSRLSTHYISLLLLLSLQVFHLQLRYRMLDYDKVY